ncbi:MAG: hypothetical protein K1Y01_05825 [Vicinamibacteria bacterium]|nr:hypothetical protein [Vicinamibacteria bacterium]
MREAEARSDRWVWLGIVLGLALEAASLFSFGSYTRGRAEAACSALGGRVERLESGGRFALVPGRAFCVQADGRRVTAELWGGWTWLVRLAALVWVLAAGFAPIAWLGRRHLAAPDEPREL